MLRTLRYLSCGRLTIWAGDVGPSGPPPGQKPDITNEGGEIVGSSRLSVSEEIFAEHEPTGDDLNESLWTRSCLFEFDVDVDRDAEFYTVVVGDREGPTYSRRELEDAGWRMDIVLGF